MTFESLRQQDTFRRRFWMEFVADPGIVNVVRLLELIDNTLADIAEWSDVVGKDSYFDTHLVPL